VGHPRRPLGPDAGRRRLNRFPPARKPPSTWAGGKYQHTTDGAGMILPIQGDVVRDLVTLFVSSFLLTVAVLDMVWPEDPDAVKEPSRRW